jgi:hypothetical protein
MSKKFFSNYSKNKKFNKIKKRKYSVKKRKIRGSGNTRRNTNNQIVRNTQQIDRAMLDLVKTLLLNNVNNRYEPEPTEIRDYTIYSENKDRIIEFINNITTIQQLDNDILHPVLSKGSDRIVKLIHFIQNIDSNDSFSQDEKAILKSQFIILNQVFGDGNHRAALYILTITISNDKIQNIMRFTERMHEYGGDLKDNNYWIRNTDTNMFEPNNGNIREMFQMLNNGL